MDMIEKAVQRQPGKKKKASLVERAAEKLGLEASETLPDAVEDITQTELAVDRISSPQEDRPVQDRVVDARTSSVRWLEIDLDAMDAAGMVTPRGARKRVVEEYRVIKRPLLLKAFQSGEQAVKNGNMIMVTSALPGEGKTFNSINLAMSIAKERDLHVLLVDADLSRPNITNALGVEADTGLVDLLEDDSLDVSEVLYKTNIENLSIIPAGRSHSMGTELLASERAARVMQEISSRYSNRIIIFDTAPVLASSEGGALARHVGQVVFVVESEKTSEGAVKGALDVLSSCDSIGLVLNKSRTILASSPYAQYYYGSYGSYYYYGADRHK